MTVEGTPERKNHRGPLVRIVVALSFVAAIWFIIGDPDRRSAVASIGVSGLAGLGALASVGSMLIAGSWASVAGPYVGGRSAFVEYLIYQPAKYLPGGVAQGLLQLSHVRSSLGSWAQSSGVFIVHMLILVTAGGLVALPAVIARFGFGIGLLLVLAGTAIGSVVLRMRGRFASAMPDPMKPLPVAAAVLMAGGGLALWGVGYALITAVLTGSSAQIGDVAQFGAGWLAGFVALPIPAGIGVREAALGLLSDEPISIVVAASIVVRLAVAGAEFGLAVVGLLVSRSR